MVDSNVVPDGHKYAALALQIQHLSPSDTLDNQPAPNLRVLQQAPIDLPSLWTKWLGSFRAEEVADANLFLIQTSKSENPKVLDHENLAAVVKVFLIRSITLLDH